MEKALSFTDSLEVKVSEGETIFTTDAYHDFKASMMDRAVSMISLGLTDVFMMIYDEKLTDNLVKVSVKFIGVDLSNKTFRMVGDLGQLFLSSIPDNPSNRQLLFAYHVTTNSVGSEHFTFYWDVYEKFKMLDNNLIDFSHKISYLPDCYFRYTLIRLFNLSSHSTYTVDNLETGYVETVSLKPVANESYEELVGVDVEDDTRFAI